MCYNLSESENFMKKRKRLIIIVCVILFIFLILYFVNKPEKLSTEEYIKQEIYVDVSGCNIEIDNDEHWGFLGDGDYYVKLDC